MKRITLTIAAILAVAILTAASNTRKLPAWVTDNQGTYRIIMTLTHGVGLEQPRNGGKVTAFHDLDPKTAVRFILRKEAGKFWNEEGDKVKNSATIAHISETNVIIVEKAQRGAEFIVFDTITNTFTSTAAGSNDKMAGSVTASIGTYTVEKL
jgi:hypothetical protein